MAESVNKSVIAVVSAVVVIVISYFVYDRVRSPCESIFEQASTRLKASISVLETSGDVALGKSQLQDLTERSQVVALNLKTCCIVFDGGKLDSKEFLNCKGDAERYQSQVARAADFVGDARAANTAGQADVVARKTRQATQELEAAKQTASALVRQVAQFAPRPSTTSTSTSTSKPDSAPPDVPAAATSGAEAEPNNSAFEANLIGAGVATKGELTDKKDSDWYRLQHGSKLRDWITIKLENRSQSLELVLVVYDADKRALATVYGANRGANAEYTFVVEPAVEYFVQVHSRHGNTNGAYALTPTLKRSFDTFEPNSDPLSAKSIEVGTKIDANIMDNRDVDWYRLPAFPGSAMTIRLDNGSTSLRPSLVVYDRNAKVIVTNYAANNGQSLDVALKVEAGLDHLVAIGGINESVGAYRLSVSPGK